MPDYYQANFKKYSSETFTIDPTSFLDPLLSYLPTGASILDIGCGSGRDLLWFKNKGFHTTGFERASHLAELARLLSGCPVIEGDFVNYDFSLIKVDSLILIGALVHVPHNDLAAILVNISKALKKQGGHILLSLKEGKGIRQHEDGRVFTLWTDRQLRRIFIERGFSVVDFSRQMSKISSDDVWLGYILRWHTGNI
ncbi:MAG: class I SAM-dependent methyltransferase [Pseudomonadota bacterium]